MFDRSPAAEDRPLKLARHILATGLLFLGPLATATLGQGGTLFPPGGRFTNEPPPVALEGTIQPDSVAPWDPYEDPGASQAPSLAPDGGGLYAQPSPYGQPGYAATDPGLLGIRFLQQLKFEFTWLPGDSGNDFDVTTLDISGTFAVPLFPDLPPLLLTPGFAVHYWEGPNNGPSLPPRVYDAWFDIGWRPQITPWLAADLGIRPGVFSDFRKGNTEAFRLQGRALGIVTTNPQLQFVAGVLYLDRMAARIIPAGGLIWTPNQDSRYEILFPNPKLAQRVSTVGNTDWWVYLAGEFGGGEWAIRRSGVNDVVDYRDYRFIVGTEWITFNGLRGYLEVGWVFGRELEFAVAPDFEPDDTVMLRAGLTY